MAIRTLAIDIETSPALVYTWALFNQNISVEQIVTPTSLLCFTAKWLGEPGDVIYHTARGAQSGDAFKKMVKAAHALLNQADAVVHYNGTTFDIPRLNQEFLRLKLPPPPTLHQIDLKKVVMSKFGLVSSKLAFVGPYLKIGEKVKNEGWPLWIACLDGNVDAWENMRLYNKQDVLLLERLYKRLLPWIDEHPNLNLFTEGEDSVCPNCASKKLQRRGVHRSKTMVYARYQCVSCGRWMRARLRDKTEPVARIR